ncbi:MAG TPA: hypothetical protein VFQ63_00335 [Patescibacteria group bacterium]|nr:hypothetical protein [Patescibacteria group bacterium]
MNIEKQLQNLQTMRASNGLKKRIQVLTGSLPDAQRGFYLRLFSMHGGLVFAAILLLLVIGSSLVASATFMNFQAPFSHVKVAEDHNTTQKTASQSGSVSGEKAVPTPTPTSVLATPTPHEIQPDTKLHQGEEKSEDSFMKKNIDDIKNFFEEKFQKQTQQSDTPHTTEGSSSQNDN